MTPEQLYIDLLKKTLSFQLWEEPLVAFEYAQHDRVPWKNAILGVLAKALKTTNWRIAHRSTVSDEQRFNGGYWPGYAHTMIGMRRLNNIHDCTMSILSDKIPGDFIETGVWRGGACILMKGILSAYGDETRKIFLADSFAGLPKPDSKYEADAGDKHHTFSPLIVSKEEVIENFRRYGLLDERVVFLKGWFKDTLPTAPIDRLALLRLDGDMYESTIDSLTSLYSKLSPGGYCIVDDYDLSGCKKAVDDFRAQHDISEEIIGIDQCGVYWRKKG